MSDFIEEGAVCVVEGCTAAPETAGPGAALKACPEQQIVDVEIISDAICPWCYIAKKRFEKTASQLPKHIKLSVKWLPFELNPYMPAEGMDRKVYRSRKFGSWEHSRELDAQVTAVGAQEGIDFRHDLMERTPNTFNAHRLVWLAAREGVQDAAVEVIFHAYFVEGRDIGDTAALAELAVAAGIRRDTAYTFFAGNEGADAVSACEVAARGRGVSGVPTFALNGKLVFSGAQRSELMLSYLLEAAGKS
jgi:predicted DsbA family dithiol-disulfide isomerase